MGCVVAGGRASRFGSDKALALWGGERLIDRARATLAPYCANVTVAGGTRAGIDALADVPGPGLGPLGGIAAALAHAEAAGFASVLTIGCDMPEVPAALLAALTADVPRYCPHAPVLGHWPAGAATALRDRLTGPAGRSVRGWAEAIGALPIPAPAPLRNVNTPVDLTS